MATEEEEEEDERVSDKKQRPYTIIGELQRQAVTPSTPLPKCWEYWHLVQVMLEKSLGISFRQYI